MKLISHEHRIVFEDMNPRLWSWIMCLARAVGLDLKPTLPPANYHEQAPRWDGALWRAPSRFPAANVAMLIDVLAGHIGRIPQASSRDPAFVDGPVVAPDRRDFDPQWFMGGGHLGARVTVNNPYASLAGHQPGLRNLLDFLRAVPGELELTN